MIRRILATTLEGGRVLGQPIACVACRKCHGEGYDECACIPDDAIVPDAFNWGGLSALDRVEVLADEIAVHLPDAVREVEAAKDYTISNHLAHIAGRVAALRATLAERRRTGT